MLDGYSLDFGYHIIGGGVLSNFNSVLSELDDHLEFVESYIGFIEKDKYNFPFLSKLDKLKIAPNIIRLLFASEKTLRKLDNVSITDTIKRYGKGKMKLILEIFSRSITTINNLDLISTGEMFRAQRNLYRGSKPVGYPKKGLNIVHKKFSDYIKKNGGKIYTNKTVEKIIIKNNKAIGIMVDGKKIHFDIIVSSILVQELFKIADEKFFPEKYVSNLKTLKGTGSLCAYYSLNNINDELIGKTFHFIERDIGVEGGDAVLLAKAEDGVLKNDLIAADGVYVDINLIDGDATTISVDATSHGLGIGDEIRKKHSISIKEWEEKTGRKMKDDLRKDVPLT